MPPRSPLPSRRSIAARNALVLANRGLVGSTVRNLRQKWPAAAWCDQEELFQEGMLGLIRAAELFDERKGWKFSTYASHAVYRKVLTFVQTRSSTIAAPNVVGPRDVPAYLQSRCVLRDDVGDGYILDRLTVSGEDDCPGCDVLDRLAAARQKLEPRLRRVLELRYERGLTLAVVGEMLGVSKERIRQLQKLALKRVQEVMER